MNNLEKIIYIATDKDVERRQDPRITTLLDEDKRVGEYVGDSVRFLLDVSKQSLIDGLLEEADLSVGVLHPPFGNMLVAFEKPIKIDWNNREKITEYKDHDLIGFMARANGNDVIVYLFFEGGVVGASMAIEYQFVKYRIDGGRVIHVDHYPCQNKPVCGVGGYTCQEIKVRGALLLVIAGVYEKIHASRQKLIHKKPKRSLFDGVLPRLPFNWMRTKGNLPKDYYTLPLDGKRYVYDKEDINIGTGTSHRYRYDVRSHPRIVGEHIVWVKSHQRGSGKYIPKIYTNLRGWSVFYAVEVAERLTRIRFVELLVLKLLRGLRGI